MMKTAQDTIQEAYLSDWTGTRYGAPFRLERPGNTAQVAAILRDANRSRTPCVIQGGRTGVSGGAAPGDGETIIALERLNAIEEIDPIAGIAVVQAGVVLQTLQEEAEALGWTFPIDLGSRGSCQLGGNAATNAGGCRVVKYGNTRESVLGIEAVMANGDVIGPPNRLVKNNAGYSLSSLLIGSEGTLGVITRLALRLVPVVPVRRTMLLALSPEVDTAALLGAAKHSLRESLSAFEVMWPDFVDAATQHRSHGRRLPDSFKGLRAALLEVEGVDEQSVQALLETFIERQIEQRSIVDAIISVSSQDAASLWALRESVGEIQSTMRPYAGFDLGMPARGHDAFVAAAKALLARELPHCRSCFFGHIGDDNLHALVGPCHTDVDRHLVERLLFELLPAGQGTVTAEHGVGRKRKAYLGRSRSETDIATMKAIKSVLDPNRILNRGRIFDLP